MKLCIREMRESDLDEVHRIERESFRTPWPREAFEAELKKSGVSHFWVAEAGGKVVGYVGVWFIGDEGHIVNLAVAPEHRRKKIAQRLLLKVVSEAKRQGIRWLTLEVRRGNLPAISLYKKFGFRVLGVRKGYYSDTGEDALLMWTPDLYSKFMLETIDRLSREVSKGEGSGC